MENIVKIIKTIHGSHLYGLDTPLSDVDYKGIFIPKYFREVILGTAPDKVCHTTGENASKNSAEDVDEDWFSLKRFINMALDGEMIALDMIHTPENMVVDCHEPHIWNFITANRNKFYSKNMKAYIGYARKQAAKYGIRGSRLALIEEILDILTPYYSSKDNIRHHKISEVKGILPVGEFSEFVTQDHATGEQKLYVIFGKKFLLNSSSYSMFESLSIMRDKYGARAIQAKNNEGVDWKAVSHALRAAHQLEEIYLTGNLVYPLKTRKEILKVKSGELDFITQVQPMLEEAIDKVQELAYSCDLPDKPDRRFWDDFIVKAYFDYSVHI